ncbi:4Fe-4S dicluster domain-containing protein [Desulforhopalus singaporensis]|uniref:Protein NrfC n=1 Tax=Desulforhopalus singaporensis TaxID=91360 RepID=A0A1H0N540_9BACT|nr:4Fe-4S dicluster domain-containing protein [Desulforhopalus singaporensis]SDO87819.1 protein NrfC [Desulforhopalus singaporensis]
MKIDDLEQMDSEDLRGLTSNERRKFLKMGLAVTGLYLGGTVLSLTSVKNAGAAGVVPEDGQYPYSPHYSMVIRERLCIDCERCKNACVKTNHVPAYGFRTTILEKRRSLGGGKHETIFMPVLCNHCNRPPCVRVCPTTATYKDEKTGIVVMNPPRCIGCKTCMTACPYNARYFKEETRAVDKCDFCFNSRLSKGESTTACVEACPADVRVFGDLADNKSRVYQLVHAPETMVWVLRPETGAVPNVFYINS